MRAVLVAWLVALCGTAGLIAFLLATPETLELPQLSENTEIVVIGSSLLGAVIPVQPPEHGILADGRAHVRWLLGAIGETMSLDLLESAIDQGAKTVLLEFSTFTTTRKRQEKEEVAGFLSNVDSALSSFTGRLQSGYDTLRGRDYFASAYKDSIAPAINWHPERVDLKEAYALEFTKPSERLNDLLRKASGMGIEVILVEPPRPISGMRHVPGGNAAFVDHLSEEAERLGVRLWLFGPDWPDTLFRDSVHLGAEGRLRFLNELKIFAEANP